MMRLSHLDLSSAYLQLLVTFSAFHSGYVNYRLPVFYATNPGFSAPFYKETRRLSSIVPHKAQLNSIAQYLLCWSQYAFFVIALYLVECILTPDSSSIRSR